MAGLDFPRGSLAALSLRGLTPTALPKWVVAGKLSPAWLTVGFLSTIMRDVLTQHGGTADMAITEFGTLVRGLRAEIRVSLRDMAGAIGLSPTYVSAVEVGDKAITQDFASKVAGFFRRKKFGPKKIAALYAAADRSMRTADRERLTVDIRALDRNSRVEVAAFARRLVDLDEQKREEFLRRVQRATEDKAI